MISYYDAIQKISEEENKWSSEKSKISIQMLEGDTEAATRASSVNRPKALLHVPVRRLLTPEVFKTGLGRPGLMFH